MYELKGKLSPAQQLSGSLNPTTGPAIIPVASETVLGGIKVGANLKIEDGVLSVDTATLIDYIDTVILGGVS